MSSKKGKSAFDLEAYSSGPTEVSEYKESLFDPSKEEPSMIPNHVSNSAPSYTQTQTEDFEDEKRTVRMYVLAEPSIVKKIKKDAKKSKISINEYINRLMVKQIKEKGL